MSKKKPNVCVIDDLSSFIKKKYPDINLENVDISGYKFVSVVTEKPNNNGEQNRYQRKGLQKLIDRIQEEINEKNSSENEQRYQNKTSELVLGNN